MTRVSTGALFALTVFTAAGQAEAMAAVNLYHATSMIPANQVKTALDATCALAPREIVLGGGWYSDSRYLFVYRSRQNGDFEWRIGARNTDPNNQHSVTAWVACATNDLDASSYPATVNVDVPAKYTRCGTPSCADVAVSGGGFSSSSNSPSDLVPIATYPELGSYGYQRWTSCFYNPSNVTRTFTAYATCAQDLEAYLYTVEGGNASIAPQATGTLTAQCDSYDYAIAGGLLNAGGLGLGRVFENNRSGLYEDEWLVTTYNGQQSTNAIASIPVVRCLDPW